MKTCPECNRPVAESLTFCPHCSHPFPTPKPAPAPKTPKAKPYLTPWLLLLASILCLFVFIATNRKPAAQPAPQPTRTPTSSVTARIARLYCPPCQENGYGITLRQEPGYPTADRPIKAIAEFPHDTPILVLDHNGDFSKVNVNGTIGWINNMLITDYATQNE